MQIRPIKIDGNLAYVPLTQGKVAVIDAADVPLVEGRNWCAAKNTRAWHAVTHAGPAGGHKTVYMHRLLTGAPPHLNVDHVDGDGLNNRRANVRLATVSENHRNKPAPKTNTTGFKGVVKVSANRWRGQIYLHGKYVYLGSFTSPEAAHDAYCRASEPLHGEFRRTAPFDDPEPMLPFDGPALT